MDFKGPEGAHAVGDVSNEVNTAWKFRRARARAEEVLLEGRRLAQKQRKGSFGRPSPCPSMVQISKESDHRLIEFRRVQEGTFFLTSFFLFPSPGRSSAAWQASPRPQRPPTPGTQQ